MESYVQCHYCQKSLTGALELNCRHSYCQDCLTKETQTGKVNCPICNTEYTDSLSKLKQDKLAPYLIGLHSGTPYAGITDDLPPTMLAECAVCKKNTDLRTCFHCQKPLCTECRTKHFESQKKEVDESVHDLSTTTGGLIRLAQGLNDSRTGRIEEYKTMKEQITAHLNDLIRKMHDEEQDLQKKLDTRIQLEKEKIVITQQEEQYLQKNKAAFDEVSDKYRNENNQMVLMKMHKDYLDAAPVWKEKLQSDSGRLNAKKEEELHFHPTQPGKNDALVGTLTDSKNVNINAPSGAKRMAARNDQTSSRACIIM